MGKNLEKKVLRMVLFCLLYFIEEVFLLYSMYNLYEPVQYIEIEVYNAEVQCSIFYTTNFIQSMYFLDLTSH